MSSWKIFFSEDAESDLSKLTNTVRQRVIEKLEWLASNFDLVTPTPLTGSFSGFYKLRVGDWRVIYEIDWEKNKIVVVIVKHRSDVYKI